MREAIWGRQNRCVEAITKCPDAETVRGHSGGPLVGDGVDEEEPGKPAARHRATTASKRRERELTQNPRYPRSLVDALARRRRLADKLSRGGEQGRKLEFGNADGRRAAEPALGRVGHGDRGSMTTRDEQRQQAPRSALGGERLRHHQPPSSSPTPPVRPSSPSAGCSSLLSR